MTTDQLNDAIDDIISNGSKGFPMHSHERTMLAKLGFADPDKKNSKHDSVCLWISSAKGHEWLAGIIEKKTLGRAVPGSVKVRAELEYHLQKGKDQYATTIGFIDILFRVNITHPENKHASTYASIGEVKISRVGIGDLLRQLKLYSSYMYRDYEIENYRPIPMGFVFCDYELHEAEIEALAQNGFYGLDIRKELWSI